MSIELYVCDVIMHSLTFNSHSLGHVTCRLLESKIAAIARFTQLWAYLILSNPVTLTPTPVAISGPTSPGLGLGKDGIYLYTEFHPPSSAGCRVIHF